MNMEEIDLKSFYWSDEKRNLYAKLILKDLDEKFNSLQPERSKRDDLTTISFLPKDLEKKLVDSWKKEMLS